MHNINNTCYVTVKSYAKDGDGRLRCVNYYYYYYNNNNNNIPRFGYGGGPSDTDSKLPRRRLSDLDNVRQ
jgi:hypothetical protein